MKIWEKKIETDIRYRHTQERDAVTNALNTKRNNICKNQSSLHLIDVSHLCGSTRQDSGLVELRKSGFKGMRGRRQATLSHALQWLKVKMA